MFYGTTHEFPLRIITFWFDLIWFYLIWFDLIDVFGQTCIWLDTVLCTQDTLGDREINLLIIVYHYLVGTLVLTDNLKNSCNKLHGLIAWRVFQSNISLMASNKSKIHPPPSALVMLHALANHFSDWMLCFLHGTLWLTVYLEYFRVTLQFQWTLNNPHPQAFLSLAKHFCDWVLYFLYGLL
jgi:hypothetical protein